ncbi:hypothetical protein ACIBGW_42145, partial [Streptomyces sp. NPDC051016]
MTSPSPADLVREFHHAFGLDARTTPTEVSGELAAHRGELLAEEAAEVAEAAGGGGGGRRGPPRAGGGGVWGGRARG